MQLDRVSIRNYRSIKSLTLPLSPPCRILVGINESGKSNILAALNLLDRKRSPTGRDIREPGLHEDQISEAYVRFVFTLTREEISELTKSLKLKLLSEKYEPPIIQIGDSPYNLDKLCKTREGLYVVNVLSGGRTPTTWGLGTSEMLPGWKKVLSTCPPDFTVARLDGTNAILKTFTFVDTIDFPDVPSEYLGESQTDDLWQLLHGVLGPRVEAALPKVLFWNYDETKLLPPKVDLDQFCTNPDSCLPLKRMFQLYRISDIKKDVAAARAGSSNALPNLLRRVAERTTEHFHRTWSEYEGIKFSLSMDGPSLVAGIEDVSNHYELSQRSDGFKRFVTFLLMVSAEDESELLRNTLLLIDEPESGLHPTGARYLMEELIDISKHNYVVFSTHSIFMVDSRVIKRHLITKKKNEITEAEQVSESNIQDEEVIFKSLGYSIFSNLKEKNLIFEGWRDKRLFETALSRVPAAYEATKALKSLGHCFARGVKQIESITPLFEAGDRKCLILSDSDVMAREHQRRYQQNRGFGVWRRFDEVLVGTSALTGEDFIKETAFKTAIEDAAEKHGIPPVPVADLNDASGRVAVLRRWLVAGGVTQDGVNDALEGIKEAVFDNLKSSEIKSEYYDYLAAVLPLVEAL